MSMNATGKYHIVGIFIYSSTKQIKTIDDIISIERDNCLLDWAGDNNIPFCIYKDKNYVFYYCTLYLVKEYKNNEIIILNNFNGNDIYGHKEWLSNVDINFVFNELPSSFVNDYLIEEGIEKTCKERGAEAVFFTCDDLKIFAKKKVLNYPDWSQYICGVTKLPCCGCSFYCANRKEKKNATST